MIIPTVRTILYKETKTFGFKNNYSYVLFLVITVGYEYRKLEFCINSTLLFWGKDISSDMS